jgi:hypothetical protein
MVVWSDENKARLLSCKTTDDLIREFPDASIQSLKRRRREFVEEQKTKPAPSKKNRDKIGRMHMVIFDTQVKPGVPVDNLRWIGKYAADKQPDVIVHIGDHWDMPSLSSYDKGKKAFEGRRYRADVEAGNLAFQMLDDEIRRAKGYSPRKVFVRGNHEYRIARAVESQAELDGAIGYHDLDTRDWEVHDFLKVVVIDGVSYAHYFANPMNGRPYGGQAATRLKTIGTTFVMGHQQILDMATRIVNGRSQHALICGASYLHDEDYLGYQGNSYWRGIAILHEVDRGSYDIMLVSMNYLCRRYEGMSLDKFLSMRGMT